MIKKLRKGLLLQLSLLLLLSGCGNNKDAYDAGADIVLLEPVGATVNYETAAYRSIYHVSTYAGGVFPVVTEYSFESAQKFAGYSVMPGEEVQAGEVLLTADTTAIDEKIADMQEALTEKEEAHLDYVADMEEKIAEAEEETAYRKEVLDCLDEENQDSLYVMIQGNWRMAVYNEEMLKKELEQTTQLFELDFAYQNEQLQSLMAEREKAILTAKEGGTVVSTGYFSEGNTIQANTAVIAVADMEQKLLKCDYISPNQIAKAEKIYAYIGGERYEVLYQKMDSEEYTRLSEAGMAIYSTFLFVDDASEVQIGDSAVIMLEFNSSEEVVTVSRSAVHTDETGDYVYVYQNGENVHTPVKTGLSDSNYIEIVSGLAVGDWVMVEGEQYYGNKTEVLERGSYAVSFGGRGYMYYPDTTYVNNEIEYGTVYFEEYHVSRYEQVEKGDVIATIRVEGSEAEITALQIQLTREEERMQDYHDAWAAENAERDYVNETNAEKKYWRARQEVYYEEMERRRESIEELSLLIQEMQADYATCQIVADRSGIVTWISDYSSEEVLKYGYSIAGIADADSAYLLVENTNQMLNYGTELQINFTMWDEEGEQTVTTAGEVVSMANAGLDADLYSDYSIIRFTESVGDMATTYLNDRGEWRRVDFRVNGTAREMDNVIVVPRAAVTDIDGNLYVNVLQEDGSIVTRSFIAGGSDMYNYWAITGLEEGMTICYE